MFDFLDGIMDPVLEPLLAIANAIIKLVELIIVVLDFLPKMIKVAFDIFNPTKLINDVIGGTIAALTLAVKRISDIFNPRTYFGTNPHDDKKPKENIFGATPEVDPETGKIINPMNSKGQKCVPPTVARLILMLLCPPFAMFLHFGLSAWFSILVCSLLTVYGFYFPGLIYAVLNILC